MDICICITESFDYMPETDTTFQPVHPKGNQSQIFIERIDAEAEAPLLWPPDAKN